jgi:uncharacterized protein YodC (DUF2158 family)
MTLEIGDIVWLKSGGPKMTVEGKAAMGGGVICKWFDRTELKTSTFAEGALTKEDPEPPLGMI